MTLIHVCITILLQRRRWTLKTFHMEFALWLRLVAGQENALVSITDSYCPNWTSRTQKRVTAKLRQDKVVQSFKNHASQKSLSDILGL